MSQVSQLRSDRTEPYNDAVFSARILPNGAIFKGVSCSFEILTNYI